VYFSFFSAERSPSAISRYINESRRVYGILEMRLSEQREALVTSSRTMSLPSSRNDEPFEAHFLTDEDTLAESFEKTEIPDPEDEPVWLVGNHCSIADLSFVTWANVVDRIGIDLETEFPVPPFLMMN
jgi:glutathione S-transferase